jgi:hypothetical protein
MNMKKLVCLIALVVATSFALAETNEADKKWLDVVQKMVKDGKTQISTPSQERVDLLKEWGRKQGYSVTVNKTEAGFRLELGKLVAKK